MNVGFLVKMISEGANSPLEVVVGPGHVVTIHPEVDRRSGQRILSVTLLYFFVVFLIIMFRL